jgi:hypothetical protein
VFIETLDHHPGLYHRILYGVRSRVSGKCDLCLVSGKHVHRPLKVLTVTGRSLLETMQESRQRRSRSRATESGTFEIRLNLILVPDQSGIRVPNVSNTNQVPRVQQVHPYRLSFDR